MTPLGLHTVSLCACALLGLSAARCLDADQVKQRELMYMVRLNGSAPTARPRDDLAHRSLSPWRYRVDRDDRRFPLKIDVAECLFSGCIVDQKENHDFNSVELMATLQVLRKWPCSGQQNRVSIRKQLIQVPVGCTCVRPKVISSSP